MDAMCLEVLCLCLNILFLFGFCYFYVIKIAFFTCIVYKEICLFTVRHSMVAIYRIQMNMN